MEEVWKPIKDYEGLYEVSNLGNVRRILFINNIVTKNKIKLVKQQIDKHGYCRVHLSKKNNRKNKQVHRLVAQAFIPNPNNYKEVNHRDENPKNNCVDNLEWCNHLYNMNYGNIKEKQHSQAKKVIQFDLNLKIIKIWKNTYEITKELGISKQCISCCCNKKTKTCGGYIWRYVNE